ncbi:MAG TPA: class A beta-lactamase [Cyclobacteriaceae bacterium]|nr:class A beta-lactamase [Cyclobacteriaceae bacterium]
MRSLLLISALLISVTLFSQSKKPSQSPDPFRTQIDARVKAEIERLSVVGGGKLGVTAIHVESGKIFSQYGSDPFPMASTYKVPIAIQLLTRVDSGKLSLDQMVEITRADLHPGSGMIADRFNWPGNIRPGIAMSVRALMELMLLISDNSATDICLRLAGGPASVNACMKRLGVNGIRVDRPTAILIADLLGVQWPSNKPWLNSTFDSLANLISAEDAKMFEKKFDDDIRDTSTPDAMADLLLKLYTKPILKEPSRLLLLDIMRRCESGLARLKGLLPQGTEVAHKTGTIGIASNDVGIITLPGDAGHLVVAAFVKASTKEIPDRERAIAEVARLLYDHFVLFHEVPKVQVGLQGK